MSDDKVTYVCPNCGYTNVWTRDEIARLKTQVVYRDDEELYSLPCRNPHLRPACPEYYTVAVKKQKR
jgi:hypothetical protein